VSPWDDYVAAAGELDVVRRSATAAVASQERAAQATRAELTGARHRIALQRARIVDVASRVRRPMSGLEPQAPDRAAAALLVPAVAMDPTPAVSATLRGALTTLDAADAALTIAADASSGGGLLADWPPVRRNALPYGWYAFVAVVALLFVNAFATSPGGRVLALGFDLAVPFGAFLLGVVSIGLLYAPERSGRKPRSIAIGILICAIPLVVGVALSVL
jgi:hypothetical protein